MSQSKGQLGRLSIAGAACAGLFALALALASGSPARAATWLEKNFWMSGPNYSRDLPSCDYHPALDRIITDFRSKEFRFWNSELRIVGFEDVHELATMTWAAQSIPRRFCGGTAVINDQTKHTIYYSIAEDTGMIGIDWGVTFCVVGLDRNLAYGPRCRAAQP
ncbi:MAG TPA: hypothetical protein VMC05_08840 [Xanthobacteraceae bacterium]|nr:hypothetical protein [Xanthobacteraceae bacterium]